MSSNQTQPKEFTPQQAQHLTHLLPSTTNTSPYEKQGVQFQLPSAIIWQIKFILSSLTSKKAVTSASQEFSLLSDQFGRDFDKYLLMELFDQIELKDAAKASKDKSESVKITLLNQELTRASLKPEFLSYFSDIMSSTYSQEAKSKPQEFLQEITKRLKLNIQTQILVSLSLLESNEDEQIQSEILKIFRQKLIDFHANGKPDQLPEYAIHRILHLFDQVSELKQDSQLREPKQFIIETNVSRFSQFIPLRSSLSQDISHINCHPDLPSFNLLKDGCGLEHLEFVHKVLQPWEVLIDIGHNSSYLYDFLLKTLSEFKNIDEKTMSLMILHLAYNNSGRDDSISKIVYNTFESNKDGNGASIKKEPEEKQTTMSWSIDNLARAFRELYSSLNWSKVFDGFGEVEDFELPGEILKEGFDNKQFMTLLQLFNKSKPQNVQFPLTNLLSQTWKSGSLQLTFISNCIQLYVGKKEKSIMFSKLKNKTQTITELQQIKERGESTEMIDVWQSVDVIERLINLSDRKGLFLKVRRIFDHPIKQMPEYLLLSLSLAQPARGNIMLDELLSILMPIFLGDHENSSIVLTNLFQYNKALFIRSICELCKHDQRMMNLSRVLDITQECKDSLIAIVYCEDYNFAVNLGILAGKRDFLHYDVWIKSRIKDIGTPFINALIKYITENIINPVSDFILKNQSMAEANPENFETQKNMILERSHLSKEKLMLTIDHLQNNSLKDNSKVQRDTLVRIQELVMKSRGLFPQHYEPGQNSEEIEAAANEHFQRVFSAEDKEVDSRIEELITTMQNFKESQIVKEQEIYACMLHGLFDEYRFLHRYPPQYLTKIAKLFGAIIKNNLLDRVLQDIALKFVFEAFRRDNRRQKFGIIVIKSFFDMLPQFPKFLEDIYNIRASIQNSEPQMMVDIEKLYLDMQNQINNPQSSAQAEIETSTTKEEQSQAVNPVEIEEKKEEAKVKDTKKTQSGKAQQAAAPTQPAKGVKKGAQAAQPLKSMTPPNANQPKEFIPTNKQVAGAPTGTLNQNIAAKVFIPTGQQKTLPTPAEQHIEPSALVDHLTLQQQQKFTGATNAVGGSLNVSSKEFQRPMSTSNIGSEAVTTAIKQININSKEFMPSRQTQEQIQPRSIVHQHQIKDLLAYRNFLNEKVKLAIEGVSKLRLDDLLEDTSINVNNEYVEDQMRIICNNTGKSNFKQKIEELKKFVIKKAKQVDADGKEIIDEKSQNAEENLKWFIQYILTKRLGPQSVALQAIYVEMIRELHFAILALVSSQSVIGMTMHQVSLIFKKCMLLDEDEVSKLSGGQANIKSYVASLGSFVGSLTIAKNEPIRVSHLDLKQILIEGFQVKNRKIAVIFVCRILKESSGSRVFNLRNPWINALLMILKDISTQAILASQSEIIMEIESLFKLLNVQNFADIKSIGLLDGFNKPNNQLLQHIRLELDHIHKKNKIILPNQAAPPADSQPSSQSVQPPSVSSPQLSEQELLRQQMSQIQQQVAIPTELIHLLHKFQNFSDIMIRKLVGNAVDNSIVEILPPVVDRSVTIALITTRELVLKDFAFDGDYHRVIKAADLIVQNLAGSLALVTCREPLRMSLNTNLKKVFETHFKVDLGLEIIKHSSNGSESPSNNSAEKQQPKLDSEGFQIQVTEDQINDIANFASRDNLELGCDLIKKKVIEKALRKVREDIQLTRAVEMRQRSEELRIKMFRDDSIVSQFQDLPPQLQPNPNGLTPAQFKVYEDFQNLNRHTRKFEENEPPIVEQAAQQSISHILFLIDQEGLNDKTKTLLLSKLKQMNKENEMDGQHEKLWIYVQKNFETACKNFDSRNPQAVEHQISVLSEIVKNYKAEDLSIRLLIKVFLLLDVRIFNDLELNILLMSKGIISIAEWDRQIANYFREEAAGLPESELQFFANILRTSIVEKKIITKEEVPQFIAVIESMSNDVRKIGKFCQYILDSLNVLKPNRNNSRSPPSQAEANNANLKDFFLKWVQISYLDDIKDQERQINALFIELRSMGIDTDTQLLFSLCKVMVKTSIQKALYFGDDSGEKRPADRLDLRYIDSFVKLIVVLLTMFSFNKHEFMTKVFEFIGEVLDEDHRENRAQFNQRPYYRMLMNILTAVNHQYCFNSKTQLLILFSMADLFKNLSPQKYPAFAFAWLELITHKQFLPHFLKAQPQGQGPQQLQFMNLQNIQGGAGMIDNTYLQKRFKIKELLVNLFNFLKNNMVQGEAMPPAIQAYYHATMRVVAVIKLDFPDFLSDFHFNFVNSIPDHCIQLRNMILCSCPAIITQPDPFLRNLKIDKLIEIKQNPRILSNYENYLSLMNLREDLENYTKTRNQQLISEICHKMEQSEEMINGRRRISYNVISAVVLFIAHQACDQQPSIEHRDTFKQIVHRLNDETRLCFLNSIVNELRYPNNHTFYFSCIILWIYAEAGKEIIQEQITSIFFERLQTVGPYPWGLMISFRELIQNPKYKFMQKQYMLNHPAAVQNLFQTKLRNFLEIVPHLIPQTQA